MCLKKEQRQWLLTEAMQTLGGCRQKTLWEDAVKNVKNLLPAEFVTMNHALKSLLGDVEYEEGDLLLEKKKTMIRCMFYQINSEIMERHVLLILTCSK